MKPEENKKRKSELLFTAIKLDKTLKARVDKRTRSLHQSYSDYVRQLIVRDLGISSGGPPK